MNTLVIEKQTGGYFKFTLNGDTANAITSIQNDLLAVGTQLHFKTGNGANIIKEQFIYPADVTIIASGTFTFTTVAQVWDKLIDIDYFAWLGGGGTGGVDRFDDLLDTFSYTGNAGKAVVVDGSELRLVPITLYNKRLFTELEDTPSSLVPNKMLVVNPAGTAVVLQDQPEQPEQLLNSVGYFDYNDLITQTTPLNAVANVALKLTNDTEGANTSTDQNPYGVSYVWDYTTNAFNFSELEVGDTIDVRVHVQVTTTSANQRVLLSAKFGIGSVAEFTNIIYENQFKSAGLHEINFVAPFYMGSTYITDNPAELYLTTDSSATVKVDGWYVRILRKNINIITVDYTVPDATTTVKGIVRLAGDLGGTANSPTVPELANKVPTSRTVSTTSPLLGGGALSSNLTLSIQQANSVDSGYLTYADWGRFDEAHKDRIVSAAVTGTTTKTLTLTQHDAGTITTSWTDDNTDAVSSVFGRTGAVVSATGDYTTTQVTEGTNLYYTNTRVSANTDVAANTAARHSAVTIGTANGLSLLGQVLSLALASTSVNGALSSTDWNTFNGKQAALSGTGFVKISGTTISYDNSTYALDSAVVKVTTDQNIRGIKTFLGNQTATTLKLIAADYYNDGFITSDNGMLRLLNGTTELFKLASTGDLTAKSFVKSGGLSTEYLMADGSVSTGGGVSGTGTTNYIPKFTGASAIGNSLIYDNGTNVGIGTTSPDTKLQVAGTITSINGSNGRFNIGSLTNYLYGDSSSNIILGNSGGDRLTITSGGNVGIGTPTDAGYKLDVNGLQAFRGTASCDTPPLGAELLTTGTGDASWTGTSFATGYTHVAGSITTLTSTLAAVVSTFYQITYTITGRTAGSFSIDFGGVTRSGLIATGKYGPLATSTGSLVITPTTDFNGTIVLSIKTIGTSAATTSFFNSTGFVSNEIRVSSSNSNTFIGIGSGRRNTTGDANAFFGNQSGISNTTGSTNAFFGINSGYTNTLGDSNSFFGTYSGQSNTTGGNNTAVGRSSLFANTVGGNNTAIGQNSLTANITGGGNTAIGKDSLQANTIGNTNTSFGQLSLANNTSGSNNVALGVNSGRYAGAGTTAMTAVSNSIYLGALTRGLNATGSTNEIVIGYDVVGLGSNTTVLGNASTVSTAVYGNLLLGTTTDAGQRLQVTGSASISADSTINGVNIGRGGGTIATNTRVGVSALNSNTTGSGNSAFGISALNANTTGGSNTAIGRAALEANTTGTTNTAVGTFSLLSNISGSNNVSLGFNSGRYAGASTTAMTSVDNSIYIGYQTRGLNATGSTNEIVIGYNVVGLGSNTTVLGNSLTTTTAIYGNVGIGTTSPGGKLHVVGKGIFDDGTNGRLTFANASSQNDIYSTTTSFGDWKNLRLSSNELILSSGGTTERMRITSGGNVGIGTSSPDGVLTVAKSSPSSYVISSIRNLNSGVGGGVQGTQLNFYGDVGYTVNAPTSYIQSTSNDGGSSGQGSLRFGNYNGSTSVECMRITSGGIVQVNSGDIFGGNLVSDYGGLTLRGGYGSATSLGSKIEIRGFEGGGSTQGALIAYTNGTERMRIMQGGNVGIGTTSPAGKLSVIGDIIIGQYSDSVTNNLDIRTNKALFTISPDGVTNGNGTIISYSWANGGQGPLRFNNASGEVMRLSSSGNVGIGTTSPSTKLDVVGAITASGGFFNSDMRLKDLIDYDYNVLDIKPITYLWKDGRDNKKHVGYSAQEVQKVMPDAVNEGTDGMLSVNYVEILVAKISQMEKEIAYLKSKI